MPAREVTARGRPAASRTLPLLPTTVVGSYPQSDWLVDRRPEPWPERVRAGFPA